METKNRIKLMALLMILGIIGLAEQSQGQTPDTTKTTYLTSSGNTYQVGNSQKWSVGLHVFHAKPMFQLEDNRYRRGWSFDLEVLSPSLLKESSFFQFKLGGHIDYTGSGTEKTELVLDPAFVEDGPIGEMIDYRIRNQSVGLHLMGRLSTKEMAITPYIDGIIGGRGLFSTQSVSLQEENAEFEGFSEFLTSDITFIYGGSLGALVKLGRNSFADFRVTYSQGSRADFVSLDHFDIDMEDYPYLNHTIVRNTRTPMLFFSAGVVFNISANYNSEGYEGLDSYRNNRSNSGGSVYYGNRGTRSTRGSRSNNGCEPNRPRTTKKKKIKLKTGTSKPKKDDKPKPAY